MSGFVSKGYIFRWTAILLYRNIMPFYALFANLRHASTNWRKVNKNKNFINLVVVFYCYSNVYYSSE